MADDENIIDKISNKYDDEDDKEAENYMESEYYIRKKIKIERDK